MSESTFYGCCGSFGTHARWCPVPVREATEQRPTWQQVVDAALRDPVLYRAVHRAASGTASHEEALIEAVLTLSKITTDLKEQLIFVLERTPVKLDVPGPDLPKER